MYRYIIIGSIALVMICGLVSSVLSNTIEEQIKSGITSTADLIISEHPRIWLRPNWLDKETEGTMAWRIMNSDGSYKRDDKEYTEIRAFKYLMQNVQWHWNLTGGESSVQRAHWPFIVGKMYAQGYDISSSPFGDPEYTPDEFLVKGRDRAMKLMEWWPASKHSELMMIVYLGSVYYDWMINETLSNGTPILSSDDVNVLQTALIGAADALKSQADGTQVFYKAGKGDGIGNYMYTMVGLALYEPDASDSDPVKIKAKEYLDDFDTYVVGKIMPFLNAHGGDGGWSAGLNTISWMDRWSANYPPPMLMAPLLFGHMTATGQDIEPSLYSSEFVKNFLVWQAYMQESRKVDVPYYSQGYLPLGPSPYSVTRSNYIEPYMMASRRRFSNDPEQQKLAKLAHWMTCQEDPGGSFEMMTQLIFGEAYPPKYVPEELEYPLTKHFTNLGWVIMRTGFDLDNKSDLVASFICQKYHWGALEHYAQNSFTIQRKGLLAVDAGYDGAGSDSKHSINYVRRSIAHNTVLVYDPNEKFAWGNNDGGQRVITDDDFPTIADGVEAYHPGSLYDVGPGIMQFESTPEYDYILGDASNAYDNSKVTKFIRQFVFLKPDKFIIFDKVIATDPSFEKRWLLHPYYDPNSTPTVISSSGADIIKNNPREGLTIYDKSAGVSDLMVINNTDYQGTNYECDTKLWVKVLLPEDAWIRRIGGEGHRFEAFRPLSDVSSFQNYQSSGDPPYPNAMGWGRFEVAPKAQNLTDYFLHVLQATDSNVSKDSPEVIADQAKLISEGDKIGVQIDQWKVLFNRNEPPGVSITNTKTSINEHPGKSRPPALFNLLPNYPNPFNPGTIISYDVAVRSIVNLVIYDTLGRLVVTLVNEEQSPGRKEVKWDGRDKNGVRVSGGIYFVTLTGKTYATTRKILIIR